LRGLKRLPSYQVTGFGSSGSSTNRGGSSSIALAPPLAGFLSHPNAQHRQLGHLREQQQQQERTTTQTPGTVAAAAAERVRWR